uniref:Uncharacterized protein n=1 Tax=Avena sativa TaxID=4498 RepID=A0ACD6AQA2_AVESA
MEEYADYYFRVTHTEHLTKLKSKLNRICQRSAIKKRYFYHDEELLQNHPEFMDRTLPSLDARMDIAATAVPELAAAAARKALAEWGRPPAEITHLVVATYTGAHMPGVDLRLASLLGLDPSVRRTMLYMNGCSSGSTALRVAKDIAENNRDARVLIACAELALINFRAPDEAHVDTIIFQALFGDGAGAVIVGAEPNGSVERPVFEMVAASQSIIPKNARSTKVFLTDPEAPFQTRVLIPDDKIFPVTPSSSRARNAKYSLEGAEPPRYDKYFLPGRHDLRVGRQDRQHGPTTANAPRSTPDIRERSRRILDPETDPEPRNPKIVGP